MIRKGLYRGWSSHQFQLNKTFKIRDLELVKLDLLNHLFTKKGERVMMATFGTIIPELIMEPLTQGLADTVKDEVARVVNYDPRVELLTIYSKPNFETSSLTIAARLFFIELNVTSTFELNLEFEGT